MSSEKIPATWSIWRAGKYAFVTLLIVAAAYVGWLYWLFKGGVFSTSNFESSAWHAKETPETDSSCFRGGMANDLKNKVLKRGASRSSVEQLLGTPSRSKPSEIQYYLGFCSGLRIDVDSLNIHFNERGQLTSVSIVQH
ncbi:MAG: hypothetical protein ACOH2K_14670 [Burkholderiaceae bacterium]